MAPPKALKKLYQTPAMAAAPEGDDGNMSSDLMDVICIPFGVLRCPNMKLGIRLDSAFIQESMPSTMLVFLAMFVTYALVLSGVIYDIINQPTSMGSERDPRTGMIRPVTFMPGKVNGQYIIEGLSAGFCFALGGAGFMLLDMSNAHSLTANSRWMLILTGLVSVISAFSMCQLFMRIKIPHYMLDSKH